MSGIGIIVTIVIFIISENISKKQIFVSAFNSIYEKTFSVRKSIESRTNTKFHFELDEILMNKSIETIILEYLTNVENISMIILNKNNNFRYLFNKLSSIALYKRMLCIVPYIYYKQRETKNYKLFSNYLTLISKIEKKKIKKHKNVTRIYSGIRNSDVEFDNEYFSDTICLFGKNYQSSYNKYRANQNYNKQDFTLYYADLFKKIDKKYVHSKYEIIFYNQSNAFELSPKIRQNAICYNNEKILSILNDKILMRQFLNNAKIETPNFHVINGVDINSSNVQSILNNNKVVIQKIYGGGGVGTYLFETKEIDNNIKLFNKMERYMVSEYIENSISVNVHIIVSKTTNSITPGSIQIIEVIDNQLSYRGADFISFRDIPLTTREVIRKLSYKVCNLLRNEGYRGIAGIDYIIDKNGKVYCSEINPRFQSSTIIISKYLQDKAFNLRSKNIRRLNEDFSIYEINKHAFNDINKCCISFYDKIDYSCYFYYNDSNVSFDFIKKRIEILEKSKIVGNNIPLKIISINLDSLENFDSSKLNHHSYLFRTIFGNKITQINSDNTLWVNNNVKLEPTPNSDLSLKIALVNQGVRLSANIEHVKKAVFSGIDFYIPTKNLYINSPINIGLSNISPFEIRQNHYNFELYYYNEFIGNVEIEKDYSEFLRTNVKDTKINDILYISSDRIRIKPINGCDYKSKNIGCKFCEVQYSKEHYSLYDIEKALEMSRNLTFDHILIGGGTDLSDNAWLNIMNIAKLIKTYYPNKRISLMSIPAPIEYLNKLKSAGISEVAFNLEIFDDYTAFKFMPGKRNYNFDLYYDSLKKAVSIFGKGNVRSAFVVGLENTTTLLKGIEELCKIGVLPCLSIYRCSLNKLSILNPTNEYLFYIYNLSCEIAKKYGLQIGPKCKACQNNMLVI